MLRFLHMQKQKAQIRCMVTTLQISPFVFPIHSSTIPLLPKSKFQASSLQSMVENSEDRFSRDYTDREQKCLSDSWNGKADLHPCPLLDIKL